MTAKLSKTIEYPKCDVIVEADFFTETNHSVVTKTVIVPMSKESICLLAIQEDVQDINWIEVYELESQESTEYKQDKAEQEGTFYNAQKHIA